MIQGERF